MAKLVFNYLDKIDRLDDKIEEDAENILKAINIDDLLKDPEGYLLQLSDAFLKDHLEEIQKAKVEGQKFANQILKES